MASTDSCFEYVARMHRVVEHIDRHLDEPLDLETLAGVANFSSFHFHRLFSAWMGETLGEYLRRRRLESSYCRLSSPRRPVRAGDLAVLGRDRRPVAANQQPDGPSAVRHQP